MPDHTPAERQILANRIYAGLKEQESTDLWMASGVPLGDDGLLQIDGEVNLLKLAEALLEAGAISVAGPPIVCERCRWNAGFGAREPIGHHPQCPIRQVMTEARNA